MIYTVGNEQSYRRQMRNGPTHKVGRRPPGDSRFPDGYAGGYAVRTIEDGERLIEEMGQGRDWAVFGMEADWETDTVPSANGWWHALLRDALLVDLETADSPHA